MYMMFQQYFDHGTDIREPIRQCDNLKPGGSFDGTSVYRKQFIPHPVVAVEPAKPMQSNLKYVSGPILMIYSYVSYWYVYYNCLMIYSCKEIHFRLEKWTIRANTGKSSSGRCVHVHVH